MGALHQYSVCDIAGVLGGCAASLLLFFSAQNYICQCFNGLHDSKGGHQMAFCSLRTRN